MRFAGEYPEDWPKISRLVKENAGWHCERCGAAHSPATGYALTVHHLDNDKSNCEAWNLAALCQRCHLHIQSKVNFAQSWMLEHSDWMKPHVEGYQRWLGTEQHTQARMEL